jgi:hypothetical protein
MMYVKDVELAASGSAAPSALKIELICGAGAA